jgi:hypothetical protein
LSDVAARIIGATNQESCEQLFAFLCGAKDVARATSDLRGCAAPHPALTSIGGRTETNPKAIVQNHCAA